MRESEATEQEMQNSYIFIINCAGIKWRNSNIVINTKLKLLFPLLGGKAVTIWSKYWTA